MDYIIYEWNVYMKIIIFFSQLCLSASIRSGVLRHLYVDTYTAAPAVYNNYIWPLARRNILPTFVLLSNSYFRNLMLMKICTFIWQRITLFEPKYVYTKLTQEIFSWNLYFLRSAGSSVIVCQKKTFSWKKINLLTWSYYPSLD